MAAPAPARPRRRTVEDRIAWLEQNFQTKDGHPWSIKGRPWVKEELFRPAYGWRISSRATRDDEYLCTECQPYAGRIVDWSEQLEDLIELDCCPGHDTAKRCAGLELVPIQVVILCLPRREGKTANFAGLVVEFVAHEEAQDVMFVAAAGDQAGALFDKNFVKPLKANEELAGEWSATSSSLRWTETESEIEVVPCSERSITGRGIDLVVVDEARDVNGDVFGKAIFSVRDRNGLTCVHGHRFPMLRDDAGRPRKRCPTCTARLKPHFGRIVIASSAGKLDENPAFQWFAELVQQQAESPDPWVHLYRNDESLNPAVAAESNRMLTTFARVPALADVVAGESANTFSAKGSAYLTEGAVAAVINPRLAHVNGSRAPALLFLDTAQTKDLISLTVLVDDDGTAPFWRRPPNAPPLAPWSLVTLASVWTWKPSEILSRGASEEQALVELVDAMLPELKRLMPLFPDARELWIDVRARPWAHELVNRIMREKPSLPWRSVTKRYQWGAKEKEIKRASFKLLEQRVVGRTIQLFDHPRIKPEIRGLKKKWLSSHPGDYEVIDAKRSVMHADVVAGLASLCERAWVLQTEQRAQSIGAIERGLSPAVQKLFSRDRGLGRRMTPDSF